MGYIEVPEYTDWMKKADMAMVPLMYLLSAFDKSWMQETHAWHTTVMTQNRYDTIDRDICVFGEADPTRRFRGTPHFYTNLGLPHLTAIGGWNKYMVLEVDKNDYDTYWTTGWIVHENINPESPINYVQIHNKPILTTQLRVLKAADAVAEFFAVNESGEQIRINRIDEGIKGDGRYSDTPLY